MHGIDRQKFFSWCVTKRGLGENSLLHTENRFNIFFRWLGKRELSQSSAEQFILHLREKGIKNNNINTYIRVINLIDIYQRENNKDLNLLKNISYFPTEKRVPTILTVEEIEAILKTDIDYSNYHRPDLLPPEQINKNYKMAIWMLASTGCRIEEMCSLKKEDLELGLMRGSVTFKGTKNHEDRQVPLPPNYVEELKIFLKNKRPNDICFTTATGNKIIKQLFYNQLKKRAEKAGITKHVYAHCFRNSFIMEHICAGTQLLTISTLVGHNSANTTLRYTKYNYDLLEKGAENHPLFNRSLTVEKIINRIVEAVEHWPINFDPRFLKKIEKTDSSLKIEFSVKVV